MLSTTVGRGGSYISLEKEEEDEDMLNNYYSDVTPAEVEPSNGHNNNNDTSANEYTDLEGFVRVEGTPEGYARLRSSREVNWNRCMFS